jgi:RNA polymerase sigma factor (TIGR02999 family)
MSAGAPGITASLQRLRDGDRSAFEDIAPLVYEELRGLAQRQMNGQPKGHTLQATALVNEAFERLLRLENPLWKDRSHFLSAAVCAMRCVLVDHARKRGRARRAANGDRIPLDDLVEHLEAGGVDLVELEDALEAMSAHDPRMARIAEHSFFGGLSAAEIANLFDLSTRTIERELKFARAWILRQQR